ncbi:hypothetical protein Atai01_48400 [Amycolatopsis taiwanensis]|uniref:Uncharacterized protein n=1 Tax=Amycolatopsis taiwanensis TaxID=342230 RepID=A0A9W6R3L9_9PSEU|nr:hypothetical protein Atai01_48400 [Amycolatopsis taiwanensis]
MSPAEWFTHARAHKLATFNASGLGAAELGRTSGAVSRVENGSVVESGAGCDELEAPCAPAGAGASPPR